MKSLYAILSAGLLFGGILSRAQTIESSPVDLDDHVSDENSPTYLDLLRLVCSDLKAEQDSKSVAIAKCVPHRTFGVADEASNWEGVSFSDPQLLPGAGPHQVMMSFKFAGESQALAIALFDLEPRPKLLDAIEITGMPDNAPSLIAKLSLTGGGTILTFTSVHGNTSLIVEQDTLVALRGNHLESVATLQFQQCCEKDDVERVFKVSGSTDLIQIRVIEHTKLSRTYVASYQWNPATKRYVALSKALDRFTIK
jgi:hypothetical protein